MTYRLECLSSTTDAVGYDAERWFRPVRPLVVSADEDLQSASRESRFRDQIELELEGADEEADRLGEDRASPAARQRLIRLASVLSGVRPHGLGLVCEAQVAERGGAALLFDNRSGRRRLLIEVSGRGDAQAKMVDDEQVRRETIPTDSHLEVARLQEALSWVSNA